MTPVVGFVVLVGEDLHLLHLVAVAVVADVCDVDSEVDALSEIVCSTISLLTLPGERFDR